MLNSACTKICLNVCICVFIFIYFLQSAICCLLLCCRWAVGQAVSFGGEGKNFDLRDFHRLRVEAKLFAKRLEPVGAYTSTITYHPPPPPTPTHPPTHPPIHPLIHAFRTLLFFPLYSISSSSLFTPSSCSSPIYYLPPLRYEFLRRAREFRHRSGASSALHSLHRQATLPHGCEPTGRSAAAIRLWCPAGDRWIYWCLPLLANSLFCSLSPPHLPPYFFFFLLYHFCVLTLLLFLISCIIICCVPPAVL